jgi:RNA polymerase sigma factor (sigma-70 family)
LVCNKVMEDKLLIWKLKRGSREALRRIYDKYHSNMLKIAVVLTGNLDTAEDIVQEVFVNFARSSKRLELHGSLKSYLITSVLNSVRNLKRNVNRHKTENMDESEQIASMEKHPDQWAILSEQLEHLSIAMTSLPNEQKEVITLRLEADMPLRKIAQLQKTSISTVNARYRYGIEKLRSLLNSDPLPPRRFASPAPVSSDTNLGGRPKEAAGGNAGAGVKV